MSCPQCKKPSNGASNRLVRDSCGHQKCRVCLLLDEEKCKQCNEPPKESVIKCDNNHTGVITCGSLVKNKVCPSIPITVDKIELNGTKGRVLPELKTRNSEIRTKVKTSRKLTKAAKNVTKKPLSSAAIPNHVTILKDPAQYKCNICSKQFTTKSQIKYHLYCTGAAKPFRCNQCPKDFITKSHFETHMLNHAGRKPFVCKDCGKSFSERGKLKRHGLLHSSTKPFVCSECGKAFRSNESLKLHTLIHRGEKPYICKICSAAFNNTSNLNKHLITHSKEKVHMCDQCGKRFKFKWTLTVHRRSHLRIRPYECSICCRAFVNNKDLQRHQLIHLETKPFCCSICMTGFRRKDNLYRHVKNTHPGKRAEPVTDTVKQLIVKPPKLVDNPNAIHVITASPTCSKRAPIKIDDKSDCRTVINGPLKLAFKTTAFKSNYNINRTCDYDASISKTTKPYDLAESVNICQKILSPHSPPRSNAVQSRAVSESTSTEICQKILSPYTSRPLHYETSFEHKKHAIIKNIKFKLPPNYTNIKINDSLSDIVPLKSVNNNNTTNNNVNIQLEADLNNSNNTYTELKTVSNASTTSVIVNTNPSLSNMHWRRRTSQNFNLKNVEN